MNSIHSPKLKPFYDFFEKDGMERMNGLSESYFFDLNDSEKEEAWRFLEDRFYLSSDCIAGLYMLDKIKAVNLFKKSIDSPAVYSAVPAEKQLMESNRLLMLKYIYSIDPDEKYVVAMSEFANSEFPRVRGEFARSVPIHQVTRNAVDALKGIIFTETKTIPLSSAITKLMVIHGMDFDHKNPLYKSIFLSLLSKKREDKLLGMKRLEAHQIPDYV